MSGYVVLSPARRSQTIILVMVASSTVHKLNYFTPIFVIFLSIIYTDKLRKIKSNIVKQKIELIDRISRKYGERKQL
jgi:hypothetical protein